jgi:hypothetical protein
MCVARGCRTVHAEGGSWQRYVPLPAGADLRRGTRAGGYEGRGIDHQADRRPPRRGRKWRGGRRRRGSDERARDAETLNAGRRAVGVGAAGAALEGMRRHHAAKCPARRVGAGGGCRVSGGAGNPTLNLQRPPCRGEARRALVRERGGGGSAHHARVAEGRGASRTTATRWERSITRRELVFGVLSMGAICRLARPRAVGVAGVMPVGLTAPTGAAPDRTAGRGARACRD